MADKSMKIRIWGARGSIPCPGSSTVRYGGNTACVEVQVGSRRLIFDGGSGIRELGVEMAAEATCDVDLYLSHFHLDHVCGLPFFVPAYQPGRKVRMNAARLEMDMSLDRILYRMMSPPLFPVPIDQFKADVSYNQFNCGDVLNPHEEIRVSTFAMDHPGGSCGYRLEAFGKVFAYATDTQHVVGKTNENVLALIDRADVAIYDAAYTEEEFDRYVGFGHSTWKEACRLADIAKVDRLLLFHHDPSHNDVFMDKIGLAAKELRSGTIVAREGMVLTA